MSFDPAATTPFGPPPYPQPPKKSGYTWLIGLALVILGVMTLGGVVCIGGVWYVATNVDRWLVGFGREAIVAMINESELPQAEKGEVITQIDRVVNAYKERKINQADLERILTQLQDSPALKALALYGIEDQFLAGRDLPEAEQEQGRRTIQRAIRGVFEGKISDETLYSAFAIHDGGVDVDDADGGQARNNLRLASTNPQDATDDLREALVKLKVTVDNAGIPDEPFTLDIGDAVKTIVDTALAGKQVAEALGDLTFARCRAAAPAAQGPGRLLLTR